MGCWLLLFFCRIIANYMMWHVVLRFTPYLSSQFATAFADYRKSVSGVAGEDPRWQDCLTSVDGSFGMPFGLLFVDKAFEGESKKSVRGIHLVINVLMKAKKTYLPMLCILGGNLIP